MSRKNGGIIGPANTPVGGFVAGVAGGVWRMNDVANFVGNSQWPLTPQNIENSVRFDKGSSDSLTRTPSSAGDRRTFTFSTWFKKGDFGDTEEAFLYAEPDSNNYTAIRIDGSDKVRVLAVVSGGTGSGFDKKTTRVFRDTSAFYHLVVAFDTTQSTADDRIKIYVNGVQETAFDTNSFGASQSFETNINSTTQQEIGMEDSVSYFGGYMAEVVFIDGQQLDPTSFGEFDTTTGIWKPKKIGQFASAGNNSFYLNFKDSSNVGKDASGLSNNFTVNNLTSIDQSTDTCVENFATLNPLHFNATIPSAGTLSDGNLTFTSSQGGSAYPAIYSTMAVSQGKWYAEFKVTTANSAIVGIGAGSLRGGFFGGGLYDYGYYYDGTFYNSGSNTGSQSSYTDGDIISVAMDLDNNKVYVAKNNTWQHSGNPSSGSGGYTITAPASQTDATGTGVYHFAYGDAGGGTPAIQGNFGSPPYSISSGNSDANGFGNFEYSVPSGYYALNTSNLNTYG